MTEREIFSGWTEKSQVWIPTGAEGVFRENVIKREAIAPIRLRRSREETLTEPEKEARSMAVETKNALTEAESMTAEEMALETMGRNCPQEKEAPAEEENGELR